MIYLFSFVRDDIYICYANYSNADISNARSNFSENHAAPRFRIPRPHFCHGNAAKLGNVRQELEPHSRIKKKRILREKNRNIRTRILPFSSLPFFFLFLISSSQKIENFSKSSRGKDYHPYLILFFLQLDSLLRRIFKMCILELHYFTLWINLSSSEFNGNCYGDKGCRCWKLYVDSNELFDIERLEQFDFIVMIAWKGSKWLCNGDSSSKASIALFSAEYVEDIEGFRSRSFPFQGSNIFEDSKDFIKPVFLKRKKSILWKDS